MKKIPIKTEYITLGQFLKLADIISTGGEAKFYLLNNVIYVDNIVDNRRGRKLYPGTILKCSNEEYEITIKNVSTATKVGSQYLNSQPAEGGIYVCVDFTYKNVSTEPISSWDFPTVELVDSNGVEYSSDVSASSYYATEKDPNRKVLSDLNPGITVTDNKVFEI